MNLQRLMENLFFTLSKIAWIFLSPTNLILISFIVGTLFFWFNQIRIAKVFLSFSSIIALMIAIFPLGDWAISPLENRFSPPSTQQEIDGIIVLGGGEVLETSLSWQQAQVGEGGDRFIQAGALAQEYKDVPIIFSGGSGALVNNTKMNQQLEQLPTPVNIALLKAVGIDESRIVFEQSSRNTYENFVTLKKQILKPNGNYLLVTSAFHIPRSTGIAEKLGINVIPYPVDYRSFPKTPDTIKPTLYVIDQLKVLETAVREWVGLTAYYWTGKTSEWFPSPKIEK